MFEKKNVVKLEINSCHLCPNSTFKHIEGEKENLMFCQTNTSCIFLRKGDGVHPIPDWCHRLKQNQPKTMRKVNVVDNFSKQVADMKRCEELQTKIPCGRIMMVDDFIECVKDGSFIDDDGCGVFADYCANKKEAVWCDVEWIQDHRKNYPFVIWYNR